MIVYFLSIIRKIEQMLLRSWFVICFVFGLYMMYLIASYQIEQNHLQLTQKLEKLKIEKLEIMELQEDLALQIKSQNDTKWMELVLMKRMGLVPKGQVKILLPQKDK